jgi:hypothetical protein
MSVFLKFGSIGFSVLCIYGSFMFMNKSQAAVRFAHGWGGGYFVDRVYVCRAYLNDDDKGDGKKDSKSSSSNKGQDKPMPQKQERVRYLLTHLCCTVALFIHVYAYSHCPQRRTPPPILTSATPRSVTRR